MARHSRPKDGVASARLWPGDPVFQSDAISREALECWITRFRGW